MDLNLLTCSLQWLQITCRLSGFSCQLASARDWVCWSSVCFVLGSGGAPVVLSYHVAMLAEGLLYSLWGDETQNFVWGLCLKWEFQSIFIKVCVPNLQTLFAQMTTVILLDNGRCSDLQLGPTLLISLLTFKDFMCFFFSYFVCYGDWLQNELIYLWCKKR